MNPDTVAIVLGTRPEIVKLAPLIAALDRPVNLIHTGQHYDDRMSSAFFEAFDLAPPDHFLGVGGASRGAQIGKIVAGLDEIFAAEPPAAVVVQGDTNSTMAAAIAANAQDIPLVHLEAGLRSHDRHMPEEHNRVVTDHLADLCLAPTSTSAENLASEGIGPGRIVVTGNTVVDAVGQIMPDPEAARAIVEGHGLVPREYVLSTFHRPENVDDVSRLAVIFKELSRIDLPVLLPLHPRTRARVEESRVEVSDRVRIVEPVHYLDFLGLLSECALVVADSGGLQEEVSIVKRPMVVVRNSTERPEVLGTFCSLEQVGPAISKVANSWLAGDPRSLDDLAGIPSPYGHGEAAKRSAEAIEHLLT